MQATIKYIKADNSIVITDKNGNDVSVYANFISDDSTETKIHIVCDPDVIESEMELPE
jgi:hypothetical protein